MNEFTQFWEHISSAQRVAILMMGMVFFWLWEGYYPLFRFSFKRYKHALVNLVFLACTLILNLIFGYTTIKVCEWITNHSFGLLEWIEIPVWFEVIIVLFLMDFMSQYAPHYLMHKISWMWRFHMVHHSDKKVDVTTGTRHHPGEWIFRESFTIVGIILFGIPIGYYFLYRSVSALFTHFNHANIQLPQKLDKMISYVLVSPNMHKVHHHFERPLTDTNFANIFALWDRLFGTFAYTHPKNIQYGLDVLDHKDDEDILYQFKVPFDKTIKTDY